VYPAVSPSGRHHGLISLLSYGGLSSSGWDETPATIEHTFGEFRRSDVLDHLGVDQIIHPG